MKLSQLTGTPRSILVQGPTGFQWASGPNLTGAANAEFFSPGDLYLNPRIRSNLDQNGNPLGSSTGALVTLHNRDRLNLTVTYQDGRTDSGSVTVSLASPPRPMSKPATPANVVSGDFVVSWSGFSNNGQDITGPQGNVHLRVTGLAGRTISTATLSDQAGAYWANPDPTAQHILWIETRRPTRPTSTRPQSGTRPSHLWVSTSSDMTLRAHVPEMTRDSTSRSSPGGPWVPSLVANPLNGNSITNVSTQGSARWLRRGLGPGSPEIDTISLATHNADRRHASLADHPFGQNHPPTTRP